MRQPWGPGTARAPGALLAVAAGVVALAAVPVVHLLLRTAGGGVDRTLGVLLRPRTAEMTLASLSVAALVGAGSLVLGTATAWAVTRWRLPLPRLWPVLAALPLAMPSYVLAFAWRAVDPAVAGMAPLVVVLVLACSPLVTLPTAAALRHADPGPAEAARTLGAGRLRVALTVELPAVAPAALAGALLAALYALSDFGAPATLRQPTLTWGVRAAYEGGLDRHLASVLSVVLVACGAVLVVAERLVRRRAGRRARWQVRAAEPVTVHPLTRAAAVTGLLVVTAVPVVLPVAVLVHRATLARTRSLDVPRVLEGVVATLGLGVTAAVVVTILAYPVAAVAARDARPRGRHLESAAYLSQAVPGIVVGLSLVSFSLTVLPGLYQSSAVLVLAYVVLFLPRAVGATRAALARVPEGPEQVARSLGHGPWRTWAGVTARHAAPGVAAGALLVAITVSKELPATLMLRPTGVETLATSLWGHTANAAYGAAAPYALALVLVAVLPAWALTVATARKEGVR